jgi:DnaJ domain
MQFFLLGLGALVIALLLVQGFTQANPSIMARQLKVAGGVVALIFAVFFFVRGGVNQAAILALIGTSLLGWRGGATWTGMPGGGQKSSGQSSEVRTDTLEAELDHETGAMSGRVLKGLFEGRDLEDLLPQELALLWQDCRFTDPPSAQILEAYLDQVHPSWRDDVARGEREMRGEDGRLSVEDAYEILGLREGASAEEVRRAHRDLMLKMHPDRGGSTYLAAQINEAKDVLLEWLA